MGAKLEIKDLHVNVGGQEILKGVSLTVKNGEIHALMGPNGSGKSTLAYALAGHPRYEITGGSVFFDGKDLAEMEADERAQAGLFLAMQYPVEVPGVSVSNFLRSAVTSVRGEAPALRHWLKEMRGAMADLRVDPSFAERSVNEGFSGGERKRHEILQMQLLKPRFAILDETDSGLDVDAMKIVADGVNRARENTDVGVVLITHTSRLLKQIPADFVHVMWQGRIVAEGGPELADQIDAEGYERFTTAGVAG